VKLWWASQNRKFYLKDKKFLPFGPPMWGKGGQQFAKGIWDNSEVLGENMLGNILGT
jgi:hypothetical protein